MSNSQICRLEKGGMIDRSELVRFSFNSRKYYGHPGDTLASALLANGVHVVSRSFKFHRPRGVMSAGPEEPNALLGVNYGVGVIPISRATTMPLLSGLKAESQNCFPSVRFDVGRVIDYTWRLWPAGFYNKIFKWPSWRAYEWIVRRAAGIGSLPEDTDPTRYKHGNLHCDVLVVGAGAAGLSAAIEAGRRGKAVILVEQDSVLGGRLLDGLSRDEVAAKKKLGSMLNELQVLRNIRVMRNSMVAGYYDHNVLTIHDQSAVYHGGKLVETFWKVRARKVVLATGAIEQPVLFGNNDLPGIMLAGAVRKYAIRFGVRCGETVVAVVNNDIAYRDIFAIVDAAVDVSAIIDLRDSIALEFRQGAKERGIAVYSGASPVEARGSRRVRAIRFLDSSNILQEISCDCIAMAGGLNPTVHLFSQAGGKLKYDELRACFVPGRCRQNLEVVGSANGKFGDDASYNIAARRAAPAKRGRQWVDFAHDVTVSDIDLAVRENFVSVEHAKRMTTTGMAADQGKTSNLNALTLLGQLTDREPVEVGTTTFRPQFMPVTLGAIAGCRSGEFYSPTRLLPAHQWHEARQAVFDDYGDWKRPAYYGAGGREAAILAEAREVRESVGLFDGSPLGKIEIKGTDAAEFLSRLYVNTVHTLQPGKVRYGLMLNENGVIIDDGVFARLADDHFLVNTTSANSSRMMAWFEEWHQCEWPDLRVVICNVTSQWAVLTIAGPRSRATLETMPGLIDLSTERFPHMSFAEGIFDNGVPYRIQRVSYTGEMSFELSVPADSGQEFFDRIWTAGQAHNVSLFGVEASDVLRTEKGFVHIGADTDTTTNPFDVGFGTIVENKKGDFIGRRSLQRANDRRENRRQFVGIELMDETSSVQAGAHFVEGEGKNWRSEGFVTSACYSPMLGRSIGLGLIERGFDREGDIVQVYSDGKTSPARIVRPGFVDIGGERMRA